MTDANTDQETSTDEELDVEETESSIEEETQDVAEETAEQTTEEAPFHEHPRFKELISEKNELKEQNQQLISQLTQLAQKSPQQIQQHAEEKIYEANTPEEKVFWEKVEKIAERKAEAREKALREEFQAEKQVIYNQYGQLAASQFLKDNPDIQRGSEELKEIVKVAKEKNLDLDDAKRIVMFDKQTEMVALKQQEKKMQKIKQKRAANVETKSVPEGSTGNTSEKNIEDAFLKSLDEAGVKW